MLKNLERPSISSFLRVKTLEAANLALSVVFSEKRCTYSSENTKQQLGNPVQEISAFAERHSFFSPLHPLIGTVTKKEQDVWLVADLLKTIFDKIPESERTLMTMEVLTKILAFRTLRDGMEILIPVGKNLVKYWASTILFLDQDMPVYGLIPEMDTAPAFLLFRGTELSWRGRKSIVSDLDLKGVGHTLFMQAKPKISAWLRTVPHPQALGYSLGGILAAYTLLFNSSIVTSATTFGQPGFFAKTYEEWRAQDLDSRLSVYLTRGDCVPKYGHLIGTVRELSLAHRLRPITAHTLFVTAQPSYFVSLYTKTT